jgi:hypothetical protein
LGSPGKRRGENELNGEEIEVWLFVAGAAAGIAL